MKEIQYEIVKEIAVLSKSDSGYTKEINLISWNGAEPVSYTHLGNGAFIPGRIKTLCRLWAAVPPRF